MCELSWMSALQLAAWPMARRAIHLQRRQSIAWQSQQRIQPVYAPQESHHSWRNNRRCVAI